MTSSAVRSTFESSTADDCSEPKVPEVSQKDAMIHGRALVGTPSDFGLRSDPPTHPELLD